MFKLVTRYQLFKYFLKFYSKATTIYRLHAPFVYQLANYVLEDNRTFYSFPIIEGFRKQLLRSKDEVEIKDFGAGSKIFSGNKRKVKHLAKYTAISHQAGKMLFRLIQFTKPKNMVELGTSIGVSALYQASAALKSKFITLEGSPEVAALAKKNFQAHGLSWIDVRSSDFDTGLPVVLEELHRLDYIFMDGNHTKAANFRYFNMILPYLNSDSLVIIADIYWSQDMQELWESLIRHDKVTLSVDFYHFGVLFFKKEFRQKEHFALVPWYWKPWILGIWN